MGPWYHGILSRSLVVATVLLSSSRHRRRRGRGRRHSLAVTRIMITVTSNLKAAAAAGHRDRDGHCDRRRGGGQCGLATGTVGHHDRASVTLMIRPARPGLGSPGPPGPS